MASGPEVVVPLRRVEGVNSASMGAEKIERRTMNVAWPFRPTSTRPLSAYHASAAAATANTASAHARTSPLARRPTIAASRTYARSGTGRAKSAYEPGVTQCTQASASCPSLNDDIRCKSSRYVHKQGGRHIPDIYCARVEGRKLCYESL